MAKVKVEIDWHHQDGNAFAVMGEFKRQAKKAGWTPEEINEVLDECMTQDYDHLISTIMEYCK